MNKIISTLAVLLAGVTIQANAEEVKSGKSGHKPFISSVPSADQAARWEGTYVTSQTDFVTIKRLTISQESNGNLKIKGALVGFPE